MRSEKRQRQQQAQVKTIKKRQEVGAASIESGANASLGVNNWNDVIPETEKNFIARIRREELPVQKAFLLAENKVDFEYKIKSEDIDLNAGIKFYVSALESKIDFSAFFCRFLWSRDNTIRSKGRSRYFWRHRIALLSDGIALAILFIWGLYTFFSATVCVPALLCCVNKRKIIFAAEGGGWLVAAFLAYYKSVQQCSSPSPRADIFV